MNSTAHFISPTEFFAIILFAIVILGILLYLTWRALEKTGNPPLKSPSQSVATVSNEQKTFFGMGS